MNSPTSKVRYRQLGNSGLRVSVPIIGGMSFGSTKWADWVIEEDAAIKFLQAAWELGINTVDTANAYSNGESERIIGKWIERNHIPRERVIIATKCFGAVGHEPGFLRDLNHQRDYVNQSGLSRAAIFNAVDASLVRLKLTYIDLLQINRFDPDTPIEETMKALYDLVQSGKVRYIGASSMRTWQFAMMNEVAGKRGWTKFVSMQNEYSLLYREEEREMNAYCHYHGIGLIPWAPLAGGILARPLGSVPTARSKYIKGKQFLERPFTNADRVILARVEELAKRKCVKMGQVALAWVLARDKVSSMIVGFSSVQRLVEGMVAAEMTFTEEEMDYLEKPYQPKPVRGHF